MLLTSDLEEIMCCVLKWTVVLIHYFNRGDVEMLKEAQARGVCHGALHQLSLQRLQILLYQLILKHRETHTDILTPPLHSHFMKPHMSETNTEECNDGENVYHCDHCGFISLVTLCDRM